MTKTMVSLFDLTGKMAQPWLENGYDCYIVDILHPAGVTQMPSKAGEGTMFMIGADLMFGTPDFLPKHPTYVAAFPPCDSLSVSGARWFKGKGLRALADSIHMFATAAEYAEASGAPYSIENPVSTISTYWRKPDHTFHPYEYNDYHGCDTYTKKTCLWTGNGFVMPPKSYPDDLIPDNKYIHHQSPGDERKHIRSATPLGFAKAVYEYNKPYVWED